VVPLVHPVRRVAVLGERVARPAVLVVRGVPLPVRGAVAQGALRAVLTVGVLAGQVVVAQAGRAGRRHLS
jgi:hypothetical protein